jgi:hypothetical protein
LSTHLRLGLPRSLSFWLSHQYPICIPLRRRSCYIPCTSHPPWPDHSNYTWHIMHKLLLYRGFNSDVTGVFNWPNPSSRTMALGSTRPLTEMRTRNLLRG